MICQRGRPYLGDKYDSETKQIQRRADYLQASISNPRNNCRHGPQGKNGSRRTTTSRCLGPQQPRCQFSLSIYKDRQGYYIKTRVGNPYHQFHPPRQMNIPTRLLEDNAKELIHDMNSARAATGVAASIDPKTIIVMGKVAKHTFGASVVPASPPIMKIIGSCAPRTALAVTNTATFLFARLSSITRSISSAYACSR